MAATFAWLHIYYISLCFCIKWHYGLIWLNTSELYGHTGIHMRRKNISYLDRLFQWITFVMNLFLLNSVYTFDSKLMMDKINQGDWLQLKCSLIANGQLLCVTQRTDLFSGIKVAVKMSYRGRSHCSSSVFFVGVLSLVLHCQTHW